MMSHPDLPLSEYPAEIPSDVEPPLNDDNSKGTETITWVDAAVRLPDNGDIPVLVFSPAHEQPISIGWWSDFHPKPLPHITHWALMPSGPRAG